MTREWSWRIPRPLKWRRGGDHPTRGGARWRGGLRRLREKFQGGKKGKKKIWLLLILAVVLAAVAAGILLTRNPSKTSEVTYTEEPVEYREIVQALSGSGTLEPANSYTVTTLTEGEILSASFEEGDIVEEGAVLYQIDSDDVDNNIEKAQLSLSQSQRNYSNTVDNSYIKTTASGILFSLEVEAGDEVKVGDTIAVIRDSATMTLTVPFPADDAQTFYVGQAATVTLDGSFETLSGTVKSVSGSDIVGVGNMITRNVKIAVENPGGLSNTQAATASVGGVGSSQSGSFDYQAESIVTAEASGTVSSVKVKEGGAVSKNQVIATLGGSDLEDQVKTAQETLRNAQLSMENTQKQLENYTITSPIGGTIVDKQYKVGDTIEAGKELCTIYDLSYLEMVMNIDELDVSLVEVGQTVEITADAVDGTSYEGVITKVSVAGVTTNGTTSYPVTVRITETEDLLPGMNVDAVIVVAEKSNVLSIPSGAVNRGDTVLITADSPSAKNALEQEAPEGYVSVSVETGLDNDSYIEITSGLQSGDTVAYLRMESSGSGDMTMMGGMPGGDMPSGGGMSGGGMPGGGGFG